MQQHLKKQGVVPGAGDEKPLFAWRMTRSDTLRDLQEAASERLTALEHSIARLRLAERNCGHDTLVDEITELVRRIEREIRSLA